MAIIKNISFYKPNNVRRIALYIVFSFVFLVPFLSQAQEIVVKPLAEQDIDQFTVKNIEVDITADNAVQAREEAFEVAQIKAYEALARRLLDGPSYKEFETPDINTVSLYVQNYEVQNEKLSAVRYNGIYEIRFSPRVEGQIKQSVMQETGEGSLLTVNQAGDTLILPFYQRAGRSFLWQANPFMQAWVRARDNEAARNAIIPVGDINDIRQVRDGQGLNYDPARLNAMRLRYNARQVMLLTVEPTLQTNGRKTVMLKIYEAKPYGPELLSQSVLPAYPGEIEDQLYNRMVRESLNKLSQPNPNNPTDVIEVKDIREGQAQNIPSNSYAGVEANITTQVNFSSVQEWVETKKTIENLPNVSNVLVQSMSPRAAILNVKFTGGEEALRQGLSQRGLVLNNAPQGQIYQIMRGQRQPVYQPKPTWQQAPQTQNNINNNFEATF